MLKMPSFYQDRLGTNIGKALQNRKRFLIIGNRRMLTDKLRTEWGHSGWVVSDCGAIGNIASSHG
jgi:beta-glucosidase-like glycosyl hydrolase